MSNTTVERLRAWLAAHENDLLEDFRAVLRVPSVEGEALPGAPFGKANRDALDFVLRKASGWGMSTVDLEGYCGYADIGSGKTLVGIFGHLDVVPVGPGWKHDPFAADIDDGYVYARGSCDDKGPTMAAFYAVRAIQECCPDLGARVRMFFGCNEESGFKCIHRYTETEEAPTYGVAPDAGWPLIHAEKGISNITIERPLPDGEMRIVEIRGGQRPNIVVDRVEARVRVGSEARAHVEGKLADSWDRNVEFAWEGEGVLRIVAHGKAAHGAWPFGGDSAAIRMFRFLMGISPVSCAKAYSELFETSHIAGAGIGILGCDDVSKDLTCNLGIVETDGDTMRLTFNVRYPVTWTGDSVRQRCEAKLRELEGGYRIAHFTDSKPLYFPLEHPLVATICDVYREETGDDGKKPGVMGGGTYARAVPNTVAIGTGWEGDGDAHETDERLAIASLHKMARIYAHLIWRLAQLEPPAG